MRQALSRTGRSVRQAAGNALRDTKRRLLDDLRRDPYLPYILFLAFLLTSFWIWHRLPNFATRDERWRVVDPIEAFAALRTGVGYDSLHEGVTYWRSYGATFYLSGLVLLPVLALVFLLGQVDAFAAMGQHDGVSFWAHWLRTPGWIWSASVLPVRLVTVAFAVGSVYLVYRLGTTMRDRATGQLSSLLFTLTWGFLVLSHEAGEDVPSVFFFLLSFYLALRYVETGSTRPFYWASLAGGVGAALKLNVGVAAIVIAGAFLLRAQRTEGPVRSELFRPRMLLTGAGLGAVAILLGYPSVVVGDPFELGGRISRIFSEKSSPHGWRVEPTWWWIVRGYLHGLGLPLAVASAGAVVASLGKLHERTTAADGLQLSLLALSAFLVAYGRWAYVRTHHLLPTFPLLVLVVAVVGMALRDRRPLVARVGLALLLVTSGAYAVGGDLGYASQPRDQSTAWLADRAGPNATIETYVRDPQEVGVPHGAQISHSSDRTMTVGNETRSPGRERWTLAMPERCPEFVVLNYHRSLLYLAPDDWSKRAGILSDPDLETFYRDLLAEDAYPYEVAATFGRQPRFLDGQERRSTAAELLRVGLRPRTMQYGDPQDLGVDQYTIVLERTGACDPEATSPFRS